MPLYDYRCPQCRQRFARRVALNEADATWNCPECGAPAEKVISGCAFHRSEASRLADFDPRDARRPGFYRDPHNIGLSAKRRLRDSGLDLGPKVEEIIDRGRTGSILRDVP